MAQHIAQVRDKAGRSTVARLLRDAGHFLGGTGWIPTTQYNADPSKSGGTPAANAPAQAELFPRMFPVSGANAGAGTHALTGAEQAKERTPASPVCRD